MSATLVVHSGTKRFTADLPTAHGELVEKIIKDRLARGLSTPLLMETTDGHKTELVEVATMDHYTMDFIDNGEPSAATWRLEHDAREADHVIDDRGYIKIHTDDL